jgi:hypothetical protein
MELHPSARDLRADMGNFFDTGIYKQQHWRNKRRQSLR